MASQRALKLKVWRSINSNVGCTRIDLSLVRRLLQARLLAGLGRVFGTGCDFFAMFFLFLLHFFVMRDISGVSH